MKDRAQAMGKRPSQPSSSRKSNRVADRKRLSPHRLQHAERQNVRLPPIGKARYDQELFSTPAQQNVGCSHDGTDPARNLDENAISGVMAKLIVHFLEVIDVDQVKDEVTRAAIGLGTEFAQRRGNIGSDRF